MRQRRRGGVLIDPLALASRLGRMLKMSKQRVKDAAGQRLTQITCHAPNADMVFVAGTFNDWNPSALAMTKCGYADWSIDLELPPGRYEYKFVVDDTWCCEPHLLRDGEPSNDTVANAFGTVNRVLIVR